MKIIEYLSNIWHPAEMQDLSVQEVQAGLADASIRKHWLHSVLDEVKNINRRTHKALVDGNLDERFVQESARLQGIEYVLRQVLHSKNSVALELHQNRANSTAELPTP